MAENRSITSEAVPLVAYQGVPGAFGETAIQRVWGTTARPYPAPTFRAALEALRSGVVSYAVIPVWNSSTGPVMQGRTALDEQRSWAQRVRDVIVPVSLALIARPDASMEDVRFVGSHPTALAQCRRLFAELPRLVACDAYNTAGAVRDLACHTAGSSTAAPWFARLAFDSHTRLAAIASERAAEHYGLTVLRPNVNDDPKNRTRFIVLQRSSSSG